MKICTQCKKNKKLSEFYKSIYGKDGHKAECKLCSSKRSREYKQKNKEKIRKYKKEYYHNNIEKVKESRVNRDTRYYKNNKSKILAKQRNNRKNIRKYRRKRYNSLEKNDIGYKLATLIRSRLKTAIKCKNTNISIKDIGCDRDTLIKYLENKFYSHPKTGEKMTWKNHGLKGWHIDHIVPLATFNLSNKKEYLKACHYTNLQPLWSEENLSKGKKIR